MISFDASRIHHEGLYVQNILDIEYSLGAKSSSVRLIDSWKLIYRSNLTRSDFDIGFQLGTVCWQCFILAVLLHRGLSSLEGLLSIHGISLILGILNASKLETVSVTNVEESAMRHFRILILGEHYKLDWLGRPRYMGFYVTRFVRCNSVEEAEEIALTSVQNDKTLQSKVLNEKHDPPRLRIDGLEEISQIDVAPTPPGFVYFEEEGGESKG